ncbi:MAG: bifunctional phosphopantothenoylcysteine decarboxylase/phosphopantothenate--cysteine ligase CoaBC [Desulfobacterales bacterium]|jgi:phosphopantothenoylcysteine decarboxylase/phosphopantothenate--cysteine ligase
MGNPFDGKRLVLGVSGGIAAYKSVELLRLLMKEGARVRVAMTDNAKWFVGSGTYQALSGLPVLTSVFEEGDASIRHIDWAQEADVVVIAPATANFLGKLANGIADDALTTFMLAVTSPVVICPAMNTHMYAHPAVQENRRRLKSMGFFIMEPEDGELACGTVGPGRLPNPERILEYIAGVLTPADMEGIRLLVTAGPTQEYLDPVRFLSNPSSGKMGFAVATAAARRGADVRLVTGPVALPDPPGVFVERVVSAREMADRVMALVPDAHIVVKAAAVSDYSPIRAAGHKMKKDGDAQTLDLVRTVDILEEIGKIKENRVLVGFAAETRTLRENALAKLKAKNLDFIVGNLIGPADSGFNCNTNTVTLYYPDNREEALPTLDKLDVAHHILDRALEIYSTR